MDFMHIKIISGQASVYASIGGATFGVLTLAYANSRLSGHVPISIESTLFLAMPASFFVAFLFALMSLLNPPCFKRPLVTYIRIASAAAIAVVTLIPFAVVFLRLLKEDD